MPAIMLTKDQLAILGESDGNAILTDEYGNHVGYVSPPLSQAELEELHRRADSDGPWYTTAEVLEHLKSLEK
jgi:hypothetical protein